MSVLYLTINHLSLFSGLLARLDFLAGEVTPWWGEGADTSAPASELVVVLRYGFLCFLAARDCVAVGCSITWDSLRSGAGECDNSLACGRTSQSEFEVV